jgi:hypothetical protein
MFLMTKDQLIEFIQDIVFQANIIKEQLVKDNAPVNYACIFCQSDDEYNQFIAL